MLSSVASLLNKEKMLIFTTIQESRHFKKAAYHRPRNSSNHSNQANPLPSIDGSIAEVQGVFGLEEGSDHHLL